MCKIQVAMNYSPITIAWQIMMANILRYMIFYIVLFAIKLIIRSVAFTITMAYFSVISANLLPQLLFLHLLLPDHLLQPHLLLLPNRPLPNRPLPNHPL